jgi:hypothetical protein
MRWWGKPTSSTGTRIYQYWTDHVAERYVFHIYTEDRIFNFMNTVHYRAGAVFRVLFIAGPVLGAAVKNKDGLILKFVSTLQGRLLNFINTVHGRIFEI